ncbi:polymorphic toxin type 44 domain-containing protein [Streptomyces sp. NPDC002324]
MLLEKFNLASTGFRTDIMSNGHGGRILYDTWSNIHYGYVGRAAGFSRAELITASQVGKLRRSDGFRRRGRHFD